MESGSIWVVLAVIFGGLGVGKWILKKVNWWLYEAQLGEKQYSLPPGDLGWPFIGNMWSFLRAFKSSDPDSFMRTFINKYTANFSLSFSTSFSFLFMYIHISWHFRSSGFPLGMIPFHHSSLFPGEVAIRYNK